MKKALKMAIIGAVLGGVELGASGLLSGVGKLAPFEDIAFLLGIFTLLIGLLGMFGVTRSHAGAAVSPGNANAQMAFASQVAFEEQRTLDKLSGSVKHRLNGFSVTSLLFLVAAVVTFAGFGVSVLFF